MGGDQGTEVWNLEAPLMVQHSWCVWCEQCGVCCTERKGPESKQADVFHMACVFYPECHGRHQVV